MIPTRITDHEEAAAELLTDAFKGQPVLEGFLRARARRWQAFEDAVWATVDGRLLENAAGVWLDKVGAIVLEPREGRNDTLYRAAIRVRIRINRSKGRAVDVIAVALLLDPDAKYKECFPLGWEVSIYDTTEGGRYIRALAQTKAATSYGVLLTSNWAGELCVWSYILAPLVASVAPSSGAVTGGTSITISGNWFVPGAIVKVGGVACTSVVVVNGTTITAVTPAGTSGAKTVTVTNPDGQVGNLASGFTYSASSPPTLASANFTLVDIGGGDEIVVTGTNLSTITSASWGGTPCTIVGGGSTVQTIRMPAKALGSYSLTVTSPDGTSNALTIEAWSPLQIGNVEGYLDARKGVFTSSANVVTWTDQKNTVAYAPPATAPTLVANVFASSKPAIRFTQTSNVRNPGGVRGMASGASYFWVGKTTSTDNVGPGSNYQVPLTIFGNTTGSVYDATGMNAGALARAQFSTSPGDGDLRGSGFNDGNTRLLGWTHDSATGTMKAYAGATQQGTDVTGRTYNSTYDGYDNIGGGYNAGLPAGGDGFAGDLGALVAVSGVISGADLAKLYAWARVGFGAA